MKTIPSSPALRKVATGVGFGIVVVILLLWLAGFFHPKIDSNQPAARRDSTGAATPAGRPVGAAQLVAARMIDVPRTESAVGTIRAVHQTTVASKILARVLEVHAVAGQGVDKGEVLARVDAADLMARRSQAQAALDAATAARDQARIELDRIRSLHSGGNASQVELDRADTAMKTAEADLERARHSLDEAETQLGYATIASPVDGIVVDKHVDVGDTVVPGQPLVTLYDPSRMQLVASVREGLTRRLSVGGTVNVHVEALGKTCQGTISEIVPEAESASRTFSVKVTGPCPPGIYSGMFGRLLIPLDMQRVLVVPKSSLRRVGQLDLVEVAEDGRLIRRAVRLGREFGESVEVLSGVREGEQVVIPEADSA